ncbi:Family S53 protease-like protein [Mycena venus]|uniref:tripeptidyl-peptidase II n=1 Tax=Mycena venus TaxID=2733690 RepID=A0A8H6YWK9_9AGAR|nr:Family S53 protease-like protein [Mycena venus]
MAFSKLLALLSVVVVASAGPMVLHEWRAAAPSGFIRHGAAPANEMITLRVALKSNDVGSLEEKLKSVAAPGSSDFRQWLSMDEVKTFIQPSPETVSAFNAFASANGLTPTVISPNGDWVSITLPVSKANQLFAADFETFTHPNLKSSITRTLSVSLPSELVGHVDVLHPTTAFVTPDARLVPSAPQIRKRGPAASCNSSDPAGVVTPTCLQDLYGIPATPATEASNTILVTGYEDSWAQRADLSQFLTLARPDMPPSTTFTLLTTDNGTDPQDPHGSTGNLEANLDIQYTAGIATGVPLSFLSVGGADFPTSLLDTTTFLDGVENPPTVMTTSYGAIESNFGASMATKICNGYMALGARGISVVFASGDGGVRGNHDFSLICANNTFLPEFPATCPFVTSVGSTQGFAPEKAMNLTGGGFSNFFPTAYYQTAAVAGFLETVPDDFAGIFNKTGRGFPDVSLQGWNFELVSGGEVWLEGGTSASSPTFASIIALINDRLISAGKPVLGFLNPFLYSKGASAFTDIMIGHNSGLICPASSVAFDATEGWDPLTGLGTPIFPDLLAAALAPTAACTTPSTLDPCSIAYLASPEAHPLHTPHLLCLHSWFHYGCVHHTFDHHGALHALALSSPPSQPLTPSCGGV